MNLSKIDFSKIIKVKASGTYVPPPSKDSANEKAEEKREGK